MIHSFWLGIVRHFFEIMEREEEGWVLSSE